MAALLRLHDDDDDDDDGGDTGAQAHAGEGKGEGEGAGNEDRDAEGVAEVLLVVETRVRGPQTKPRTTVVKKA